MLRALNASHQPASQFLDFDMCAAGTGATTGDVERIKGLSVPQQLVLCAAIKLLGDGGSANKLLGTPLKPLVNGSASPSLNSKKLGVQVSRLVTGSLTCELAIRRLYHDSQEALYCMQT